MKDKILQTGLLLTAGMALSNLSVADTSPNANLPPVCLKTELTQVKDATCEAGATLNDGACAMEIMAK